MITFQLPNSREEDLNIKEKRIFHLLIATNRKNLISSRKRNSDNLNIYNDNNKKAGLHTNNSSSNNDKNKQKGRDIVSKVKVTRACVYLCFCFIRRRKIIQNYLLDEGMNIISEKMDIFNIFEKMYKDEEIMEKIVCNKTIQMSDECKIKLQTINHKFYET